MATRIGLVLLLLTMTLVNMAESFYDASSGRPSFSTLPHIGYDGLLGDTIDVDEEMMLDSESARRTLKGNNYISYGAMNKNNVPCNRRGNSYYNSASASFYLSVPRVCTFVLRLLR